MASLTIRCFIPLLTCLLIGQVMTDSGSQDSGDVCGTVPKIMTIFNGYFDNRAQVERGNTGAQYIEVTIIPVVVPALKADYVFVITEALDNKVKRENVCVVTEVRPGVVRITPYNVTNLSYIKPPSEIFNVDFSTLGLGDIQLLENCTGTFKEANDDIFGGGWEVCRFPGVKSHYVTSIRCNGISVEIPSDAPEVSTSEPYVFVRREGSRFPIPGAPASCAKVCEH